MSRSKSKHNAETCGDCGALDATWASLNKGILLCTQCCSVHRSLGKHISQVKSLEKSLWNKNQLEMIHTLSNNGANNIWEHALLENNSKLLKKKPTAKDALSAKQEFIKAKHKECAYALRENSEDGLLSVENELGKQLHASVRTPNLELTFRFLALGADPNYFHDEKGTTPLHVAIKTEQKLQVELLLVYGADPTYPDAHGRIPVDYAKDLANKELYYRLIESQYEVTDTFSYYLSMQKPDHNTGIHYFIPQTGFKSNPTSLAKLQKLRNPVFEELVMDVYDEVERRENEAIWLSCADTTDLNTLPFLPVDNTLSSTRNQGRQKLARFSTPELKSLVYDILLDTQRRQSGTKSFVRDLSLADEDPLYDSVASDDDYAIPAGDDVEITSTTTDKHQNSAMIDQTIVEKLQMQLKNSDSTISNLRNEIIKLKQCLNDVKNENVELRSQLLQAKMNSHEKTNGNANNKENIFGTIKENSDLTNVEEVDIKQLRKSQRPLSMYETREGITRLSNSNWQALKNEIKHNSDQPRTNVTQSLYSSEDREIILQSINNLTKMLQILTKSIGQPDKEDVCSCAEQVKLAIIKLAATIPKGMEVKTVRLMLRQCTELKEECSTLQQLSKMNDEKLSEQQINKIRNTAFHLAYNSKEIVNKYVYNHH